MQHYTTDQLTFKVTPHTPERLKRAVIISLFTWAKDNNKNGWWGDDYGVKIGSKLWKLQRTKLTAETIADAKIYCEEALKWLLDDKIASDVKVIVERNDLDKLFIAIEIILQNEKYIIEINWNL